MKNDRVLLSANEFALFHKLVQIKHDDIDINVPISSKPSKKIICAVIVISLLLVLISISIFHRSS